MRRRTMTGTDGPRCSAAPRQRRDSRGSVLLAVLAVVLFLACPGVVPDAPAQRFASSDVPEVRQDEAVRLFRDANELYADGDHGAAADLYEAIVDGGFPNAEVYYNLANARYMEGEIAQAVLGYERALRLDGSHEDATANLEFVREQLADRQVRVGGAFSDAVERFFRRGNTGRLTLSTSLFFFLVSAGVIAAVLKGGFTPWLQRFTTVMVIHLAVAGGLLTYRIHRESTVHEAVIVVADVPVRTGPGDDFVLEFRLHEGTKIRVREARGDWARVSVEGTDLEGWLPERAVEEI